MALLGALGVRALHITGRLAEWARFFAMAGRFAEMLASREVTLARLPALPVLGTDDHAILAETTFEAGLLTSVAAR